MTDLCPKQSKRLDGTLRLVPSGAAILIPYVVLYKSLPTLTIRALQPASLLRTNSLEMWRAGGMFAVVLEGSAR